MEKQLIPAGYKQTEVGVIPDEWNSIQVQDVCDFIVPGRNKPLKFNGDIPWITTPDLTDCREVYFSRAGLKISKEEAKSVGSKIVPVGSVIMSCVGELGVVAIAGRNVVLNQQLHAFLPSEKINNYYLVYALKNQESYFYSMATKTALPYLNKDNCNSTPLPLPSIQEQTAIANALSDVDALIAALEKLINKKSAIKTAAMQQLLTGKKRLPPFDQLNTGYKQTDFGGIPEDWEVASLGDIGENIIGLTYSPDDVSDFGTLVLRSSNVQNNRLAFDDNVFVNMDIPERVIVREGDILICVRNGSRQLIGKCALIDKNTSGSAFGAFMSIYRSKSSNFVFFQFQSNIIQNQINEVMGATINQITNKDMAAFKILLPKDEKEQTAIANALSDMDKDLDALQQRLHKTQQIKQGMMQELLTGKTRLVKPRGAPNA
ncbi:restriction endonuclease subunit S [Undibacterium pigrum]|nr:restriction endonuclease subunit S [Undibacterium pigrum]